MVNAKIRDVSPVNAAMFKAEGDFAATQFAYFIGRRDQLQDRMRFGILALNGASIIALMSLLGGDGSAASWLGFTPTISRNSAAAFSIGVLFAGISIMNDANLYVRESGHASVKMLTINRLNALYEAEYNDESFEHVSMVMKEYHELPFVSFQFSYLSIICLNAGAGAWLFGILLPLIRTFS